MGDIQCALLPRILSSFVRLSVVPFAVLSQLIVSLFSRTHPRLGSIAHVCNDSMKAPKASYPWILNDDTCSGHAPSTV